MNQRTEAYLLGKFKEYYNRVRVAGPPEIEKREFGVGDMEKKIKNRHYAFRSEDEFNGYLKDEAPPFISYSVACYEHPDATPMQRKDRLGADFVFDFDADEIPSPCKKDHDPHWVCDGCMETVKEHAFRLLEDFLFADFGFTKDEISINFSGSRGYHIHVMSRKIRELGRDERKDIIGYVTGREIDPARLGIRSYNGRLYGPSAKDPSWRGRVNRAVQDFIGNASLDELRKGMTKGVAEKVLIDKQTIIGKLREGYWDLVPLKEPDFWIEKAREYAKIPAVGADEQTSLDIAKLIRVPDTIHGGSGLVAKRVKDLEKFDPFKDTVIFGSSDMRVTLTRKVPAFVLGGQSFGPFELGAENLPEFAGIYLCCKGMAEVGNV